ncbi:MAG: dehydratase [Nitrospinae bacterium]|nr:dehydratase [Nitrospinota bacterium]
MGAEFMVGITHENMAAFRRMSGDENPLHIDPVFAREAGFKDNVVYGMLVAAYYSTLVGMYLPGRFALLHGVDVSFQKPVFLGESLTVRGEITYLNEAFKQMEIKASIINQDNVIISKAKIKTGVRQ